MRRQLPDGHPGEVHWPTSPDELQLTTTAWALAPRSVGGSGMTRGALRWALQRGRCQRIHHGVILTRPGPVDWITRAAAALLFYGEAAALNGPSAGVLHGLVAAPSGLWPVDHLGGPPIHVRVPAQHRPAKQPGVILRHSDVGRLVETWPRRTAYDTTVIDLIDRLDRGRSDEMTSLLASALRSRRTTPGRLLAELEGRQRFARRAVVRDILTDLAGGAESTLEVRFVRDVLRRHGLPCGVGQWPASVLPSPATVPGDSTGPDAGARIGPGPGPAQPDRRRFDRSLPQYRVLFELDGELYHYGARRAVDRHKSSAAARAGWLLLRYGWEECTGGACRAAVEIGDELARRGWTGRLTMCGPRCEVRWRAATSA